MNMSFPGELGKPVVANLQERFELFVTKSRGFENIDDLLRDNHIAGKKRADYLLWQRQVVVEQKVLVGDPFAKAQKFIADRIQEKGIPAFGTFSTDFIFSRMPDGQEQKRRMFLNITKGLEASFATADKQTRDTREIFSIPNAIGIVILLNLGAPTLHPDLIQYGLSQALQKRMADGSLRYPHNDGVVMISEAHVDKTGGRRGSPCYSSPTPHARNEKLVRAFSETLIHDWAAFNGVPVKRQDAFRV
jgi:hypothetical protein